MKFAYTAVGKDGKTQEGTAEAPSREALIAKLSRQGTRPIIVKIASDTKAGALSFLKKNKRVKSKELVIFTRQLSTMIGAGVPIARSLATLQGQSGNKYFREVVASLSKDIEGGAPLGDAFGKFPNVFSDVYINMIRAGEAGGILDEILKRLAAQVEKDASIRKRIIGAMTYPIVILSITVVAFFGIMIFIMPKLAKIITSLAGPNTKLPIYTRALLGVSNFFTGSSIIHSFFLLPFRVIVNLVPIPFVRGFFTNIPNAVFIIIILITLSVVIRRYIKTPKGRYQFHSLLLRTPIISNVVTKMAVARFSRTFASLMAAGVGVLDALDVTGAAIGNKVIENELHEAAKAVKNGKQLSVPLSQSKYFPAIVSQMIAVGEETGKIDTVLLKVAEFYEEEVDAIIDALSSIIEPLLIVVLGSIVGVIAASVMGPIASLNKNIGNN